MRKIFTYLKPYTLLIILAVGLLFIQANTELALPDYMSRIVNVGIQQSGIETAVPEAIRKSQMEKISLFLSEQDRDLIHSYYSPVDPDSSDYQEILEKYPLADTGEILILNTMDGETPVEYIPELAKAMTIVSVLELAMSTPANAEQTGMEMFNMSMLPEGTDPFTALKIMPEEQKNTLLSMINSKMPEMDEMMLKRSAVMAVKNEYTTLGMDMGKIQNSYIFETGAVMIILTLIMAASTIFVGLIAARTAAGVAMHARSDVFSKVESFTAAEFDKFSTASLITRSTNDVTQVQMLVFMMVRMVLYAPIMGIGGVIRAFGKAPSMAWIIGLAVLLLLVFVSIVVSIAMPRFKLIQKLIDKLNRVARENLSGIMVVRAFNRQKFEENRFDTANKDLTKVNLFVIRVMVVMMPAIMLIMNLLSVTIIWIGAKEIEASSLQIGDMMAFLQYAMLIVMSFMMLTMMFIFLPRSAVSAARISEVLDMEPSIKDPENPEKLPEKTRGELEFRNVSFKYPGAEEAAVHGISFTAEPGKTTAIIGSTGAGKSTLVNLIPRFYDVSEGEIHLDGIDIRNLNQKDLRSQIGYVPQKITLFSGTIKSNLKYADENADNDRLDEVVKISQSSDFVNEKEKGLDSPISQGGTNISGGQKQRLSIARALVKKFPVLIFDDSFSALDFKTDAALRKALKEKAGDSTLIIIAQRVSTIMNAEQIIVLDEGKIVGKGTHKELLKTCSEYKEIAVSQLDIKELA